MQTFLPYSSFQKSAQCLDYRRLGKQRVEALQILQSLRHGTGWRNHPATKMWRSYEQALVEYGVAICDEWIHRGYRDTCRNKILALSLSDQAIVLPPWIGDFKFHRSHQSNLVHKDPKHYRQFFPDVPDNYAYVWPI